MNGSWCASIFRVTCAPCKPCKILCNLLVNSLLAIFCTAWYPMLNHHNDSLILEVKAQGIHTTYTLCTVYFELH